MYSSPVPPPPPSPFPVNLVLGCDDEYPSTNSPANAPRQQAGVRQGLVDQLTHFLSVSSWWSVFLSVFVVVLLVVCWSGRLFYFLGFGLYI